MDLENWNYIITNFGFIILFFTHTTGKYLITLWGKRQGKLIFIHCYEPSPYPGISMYSGPSTPRISSLPDGVFWARSLFWLPENQTKETPTSLFLSYIPMHPEQPSANDSGRVSFLALFREIQKQAFCTISHHHFQVGLSFSHPL